MSGRADWALELQIEQTKKESKHEDVQASIDAVLGHIRSGRNGKIRGGRELVRLLEVARFHASEEDEWHVVRLLQDALDYSEGRALKPEFEERFHLFQDGKRQERHRDYIRQTFTTISAYLKGQGNQIIHNQPNLTAKEFLDELTSLMSDGQFAEAPDDRPGRYRIVRGRAEMALWLERIFRNRIDIEDPAQTAQTVAASPEALSVLASEDRARTVLRAAELKQQADGLDDVRRVAEDPEAAESDLHRVLKKNIWMFGGRYLGAAVIRRLTIGNELDIPLIRADGALHVVELKRSMRAGALVKRYRNAWVPTALVHDAVGQAINYLVSLDDN